MNHSTNFKPLLMRAQQNRALLSFLKSIFDHFSSMERLFKSKNRALTVNFLHFYSVSVDPYHFYECFYKWQRLPRLESQLKWSRGQGPRATRPQIVEQHSNLHCNFFASFPSLLPSHKKSSAAQYTNGCGRISGQITVDVMRIQNGELHSIPFVRMHCDAKFEIFVENLWRKILNLKAFTTNGQNLNFRAIKLWTEFKIINFHVKNLHLSSNSLETFEFPDNVDYFVSLCERIEQEIYEFNQFLVFFATLKD